MRGEFAGDLLLHLIDQAGFIESVFGAMGKNGTIFGLSRSVNGESAFPLFVKL